MTRLETWNITSQTSAQNSDTSVQYTGSIPSVYYGVLRQVLSNFRDDLHMYDKSKNVHYQHAFGNIKICNLQLKDTWYEHIFALTETTRNQRHQNVLVTGTKVKTLSYIKQYSNQSGLRNTTLGYGFHFQHRNSRTFPI
jgi:hypothetical protein